MKIEWLFKISYVGLLLALGLLAERLYFANKFSPKISVGRSTLGTTKVLILGPSIASSLNDALNRQLDKLFPNQKFAVSTFAYGNFSATDAANFSSELAKRYEPKIILAMFDCADQGHDSPSEVSGPMVELSKMDAPGELSAQQSLMYREDFETLISSAIAAHDFQRLAGLLYFPNNFLHRLRPLDLQHLDRLLEKESGQLAETNLAEWKVWQLFEFLLAHGHRVRQRMAEAGLLTNSTEKVFYASLSQAGFSESKLLRLAKHYNASLMNDTSRSATKSCSQIALGSHSDLIYDQIWFCAALKRSERLGAKNPVASLAEMLASSKAYLLALPIHLLRGMYPLKTDLPGPIGSALKAQINKGRLDYNESEPNLELSSDQYEFFRKNLSTFYDRVRSTGQALVFLQLPNARSESMVRVARELTVPLIESFRLFDQKIASDGYDTYFKDHHCGSGHLTELGAEIFSEHLALELKPIVAGLN